MIYQQTMSNWRVSIFSVVVLQASLGSSPPAGDLDFSHLVKPETILVYEKGHIVAEKVIDKDSAEERAITAWLKANQDEWHSTIHTYAPSRYIRGANYTLNFTGNSSVLNYQVKDKGPWRQVIRQNRKDEKIPDVFPQQR
jgi:hypothetical protein